MAGGRAWRLLGYVVVFHLSSAEGETGSVPCVSSCRASAASVRLGYFPKMPRAGTMLPTCLSISSLSLPPRIGLAAGSGAEADDCAGKNMSSRQNPFP